MIQVLKTLTKIQKQEIDNLLEKKLDLENRRHKSIHNITFLQKTLIAETLQFINNPCYINMLETYKSMMDTKILAQQEQLQSLELELENLQKKLYDHFVDFKKFDLIKKQKILEKDLEISKSQNLQIDEINSIKYNYIE